MISSPCVILAGGLGSRLRSVVADRPKCLARVGNTTVLALHVESLIRQGFERFILSLCYLSEQFEPEIARLRAKHPKCQFGTVVEPKPLGTGGAILYTLEQSQLDEAIVTNGDTISAANLSAFHPPLLQTQGEMLRMGIVQVQDRSRYGGVVLNDHRVTAFIEKGVNGKGLINAGIYRIHRSAFTELQAGEEFSLEKAILPNLAQAGHVLAATLNLPIVDIGLPSDYLEFCRANGMRSTTGCAPS
jgi:D-glycero-alpha-D-manno-heptose 1-phosphate guanylyltransferase